MVMFDLSMALKDSRVHDPVSWYLGVRREFLFWDPLGGVKWVAKIWKAFKGVWVRVGRYDTRRQARQAYMNAVEEMCKEMNEKLKAVFGRTFFGKHDGSISSFQVLLVLENLDGIVSWERLFGNDEAAKTIKQIYGDAHLDAVIQRIRNPGTYPSWKDYVDYEAMEQICGDALHAAETLRITFPGIKVSWKDYVDYEDYEAYKEIIEEVDETSWVAHMERRYGVYEEYEAFKYIFGEVDEKILVAAHTRAHMERVSWGFVGGKRNDLRGYLQAGNYRIYTGPWDTRTTESMMQTPSVFSCHLYRTGPVSDHDVGIQNPTDIFKIICDGSVRNPLLLDHAVQHGLAKNYGILFRNLLNVNLPICERWTDVGSTMSRTMRNVLKKVWSMQSGGPNIVSNGLDFLKSVSKLAVGMVLFGNTPAVGAVGAMTPEAAEPGSVQADGFEKSSNFAFGVVACVGTFVAIVAFVKSVNWKRRHSVAGTSAARAPAGAIMNRRVNMAQTHAVMRLRRETESWEVEVVFRDEEGAYAS